MKLQYRGERKDNAETKRRREEKKEEVKKRVKL